MATLDIRRLKEEFWNSSVMSAWQEYFLDHDLSDDFYLDINNILRLKETGEGVAYVGGVEEKAIKGLFLNRYRDRTSSFQYIFGYVPPLLREDNLLIGGTLSELIAEPSFEDWLKQVSPSRRSQQQIYSILAQLIYAAYLAYQDGLNVRGALVGIKIRQVAPETSVPFFDGRLKTYGVIPVIFELAKIEDNTIDLELKDLVIPYLLDLLANTNHWSEDWNLLLNPNVDLKKGHDWNVLVEDEIYSTTSPDLSCRERECLGEEKFFLRQ